MRKEIEKIILKRVPSLGITTSNSISLSQEICSLINKRIIKEYNEGYDDAKRFFVERLEKKKKKVNRSRHEGSSKGYQVCGLPLHLTKYQNGYNKAIDDLIKEIKGE